MSDLTMISWVLVVVAEKYSRWQEWVEDRDLGIGGFYTEEIYRRNIVHWRELGVEAARQEARND